MSVDGVLRWVLGAVIALVIIAAIMLVFGLGSGSGGGITSR